MSPLESAEDSESGLSRTRELLSRFVWQRENEAEEAAERQRYREMITADAKRSLSAADVVVMRTAFCRQLLRDLQ